MSVPVLAAPFFEPAQGRIDLEVPDTLTLAEIVNLALPWLPVSEWGSVRLTLVTIEATSVVEQRYWRHVKPRDGVHVVIRVVPTGDSLRSILALVVAVAATALSGGAFAGFGAALGSSLGIGAAAGQGLVQLGLTALGNLAVNALVPPPEPEKGPENSYTISGFRNKVDPDGAIPVPYGKIRYAPPFACRPYNQIINGEQHIVSMFLFGYGGLNLSDFRLGESSLGEYDEVEIEVREGLASDLPISLFSQQIVEEQVGTLLARPLPRNDLGEIQGGQAGIEKPIVRNTGSDASGASVILFWPSGLGYLNDKGRRRTLSQVILIENRIAGAENWQEIARLRVSDNKFDAFYRQHTWDFTSRGKWEVRLTMLTDEAEGDSVQQRAIWGALQTLRPEYPINMSVPMSLVALRIKATDQINGQLDNFNAIVAREALDWDHVSATWILRETRNPASHFRHVLQSAANAKPVSNNGIDLELVQEWHDFCRVNGLEYNRVMDQPQFTMSDALKEIAAAGRASPRHDGVKWGVTIDRPQELVVDHINPRNAEGFKVTRSYVDAPDGWRVKFSDETNRFREAERVVPWPGHIGPINLTEQLQLPGKTNPDEIYREALRRAYETIYRPDIYEALQDGPARVATRGDLVMANHSVLSSVQIAARVTSVDGNIVSFDEDFQMEEGENYAIRFRYFDPVTQDLPVDTIGKSIVRDVSKFGQTGKLLTLEGEGQLPSVGTVAMFGLSTVDSKALVVRSVEAAENGTSQVYFIDAAPIIDELVEAADIPAWSGRVGSEIAENLTQPAAPRFTQILSGLGSTESANLLRYQIAAGSGAVIPAEFEVEFKLASASVWTSIIIPVANGGGDITQFASGTEINLRVRGISARSVAGPYSVVITTTIGADDADIPEALVDGAFQLSGGLGGIVVNFATGADLATQSVRIYRSTSPVLNRETDLVGAAIAVNPNQTYASVLGDTTRVNLLAGLVWNTGADWTVDGTGVAKTGGTASQASQNYAFETGKHYRIGYVVTDYVAGTVTPKLTGGSDRTGGARSENGQARDRIQAVTGNDALTFAANATFEGKIDEVVMILETAACLDQGLHYVWIEPVNDDDAPGPMSGPLMMEVV